MQNRNKKISIIGLGYVGLPLAVAFSAKYNVLGFDINQKRIEELKYGNDSTLEIDSKNLLQVIRKCEFGLNNTNGLWLSYDSENLKLSNVFIITVPTPIDKYNRPVLIPMIKASETVAKYLKKGDIIIYESTV